ncbi:LysR substrate-binding domain-containing protein [Tepidicaulis sp. LMO-SS28]|uniref:hydrogen peroxide-inducible genes activator n=1 Tax=Tepidicaulis sp. LMO-SS28 TaxID=3447455 RepID=UPI003EDEAD88
MNGLTLKHLRYFMALSRHGHFGRAAEACGISQPALSVQIKELEMLLGAPLTERSARQIRLSSLGEALAERAREILSAVDELDDLARISRGSLGGRLRIGVIPTIAPYLLPGLIKELAGHYPDLDIQPREAVTRTLLRDLGEGQLDLAIVALPVSESAFHEEPLFDEEFVLVRPLADADKPVPNPKRLLEMRLLLLEEGHCFRDQALSFCSPSGLGTRELIEGSSLTTLVQMVSAGIGVTLIPEMAVQMETLSAQVSVARLPRPHPKRTVGIVWRKSSPMAPRFSEMAETLRSCGRGRQGTRSPAAGAIDD